MKEAFREYTSALADFNSSLKELANACGVTEMVTSYSIRHSFATTLKEQGVPIEMISELLGHPIDQDDANLFEELLFG